MKILKKQFWPEEWLCVFTRLSFLPKPAEQRLAALLWVLRFRLPAYQRPVKI